MVRKLGKINIFLIILTILLCIKIYVIEPLPYKYKLVEIDRSNNISKEIHKPTLAIIVNNYGLLKSDLKNLRSLPKEITFCTQLDFPQYNEIQNVKNNILIQLPKTFINKRYNFSSSSYPIEQEKKILSGIFLNKEILIDFNEENYEKLFLEFKEDNYIYVLDYGFNKEKLEKIAKEFRSSILQVDLILDEVISEEYINKQLEKLEKLANRNGKAIAIADTYPETINTLLEWLPTLKDKNIEVLSIEDFYKIAYPVSLINTKDKNNK